MAAIFLLTVLRKTSLVLVASGLVGLHLTAAAQYQVVAYGGSFGPGGIIGTTTTPGDVTYSYNGGNGASSSTTFTSSPIASVSYVGTAVNPFGQIVNQGGGIMTYRFEVSAQPFTNVPIDFEGVFSSSLSSGQLYPSASASTSFLVQTVNSTVSTYSSFQSTFRGNCAAPVCLELTSTNNGTHTFFQSDLSNLRGSFAGTLDMLTNADGKVTGLIQMVAIANIDAFFIGGTASAFVDPRLTIDNAFLLANPGASLFITPGVGNEISLVPEPSTYLLMLAGLMAVGGSANRLRAQRRSPQV